ncbi:MAG: DNA-binding response regulator [Cellvibrio sp. 79]|nr:MAG: DNA-binding response regulator [Cellvibrio sp. 79]
MKICLTEDDLELGQALSLALQNAGFEVIWVRRIIDTRTQLAQHSFDALVLDVGLPDGSGFDFLHDYRKNGEQLPIVIITARDSLEDKLHGLNVGADDYLVKPFEMRELIARIKAQVRGARGGQAGEFYWSVKDLSLDTQRMCILRRGHDLPLSKTEYLLLEILIRHAGRVLTRHELEKHALSQSDSQSLDVHMSNLRKKIGEGYIRTMRGIGYLMEKV